MITLDNYINKVNSKFLGLFAPIEIETHLTFLSYLELMKDEVIDDNLSSYYDTELYKDVYLKQTIDNHLLIVNKYYKNSTTLPETQKEIKPLTFKPEWNHDPSKPIMIKNDNCEFEKTEHFKDIYQKTIDELKNTPFEIKEPINTTNDEQAKYEAKEGIFEVTGRTELKENNTQNIERSNSYNIQSITDQFTELDNLLIEQRCNNSGLSNRKICKIVGCTYYNISISLAKLMLAKKIPENWKTKNKAGRPKKYI